MRIAVLRSRRLELFGTQTDALQRLRGLGEVEEVYVDGQPRGLAGFDVAIVEPVGYRLTREFFEHSPGLRMVYVHGRGYDCVDVGAARERGVLVGRVPGWCEAESVAEFSVVLLGLLARRILRGYDFVRRGLWSREGYASIPSFLAKDIRDMTVGIVGFGWIGSRVARILRGGFGVERILVYDPYVPPEAIRDEGFLPVARLEDLLREADAIMIHAELTEETYHLIGERELALAKDGVVIVNTARGAIVDTQALLKALESGKVSAAALDVVEGEPIGGDHPLLSHPNVIVTPHIAYATRRALECMDYSVVEAVRAFAEGRHVHETIVAGGAPGGSRASGGRHRG